MVRLWSGLDAPPLVLRAEGCLISAFSGMTIFQTPPVSSGSLKTVLVLPVHRHGREGGHPQQGSVVTVAMRGRVPAFAGTTNETRHLR
jgi:hypothetical protein